MDEQAIEHLEKARQYLTKGEEFYRKAAAEMRAAKDGGATWVEIGDALERSESWCKKIVTWAETPANDGSSTTPWEDHKAIDVRKTKQMLREAPMEQVEQIISELPKERQQQIAAAAGDAYAQARVEFEEAERNLTPAQRAEREANRETVGAFVTRAVSGFSTLGIVGYIESATDELRELIEAHAVTPEIVEAIGPVLVLLNQEYEVATAMAGLETEQ